MSFQNSDSSTPAPRRETLESGASASQKGTSSWQHDFSQNVHTAAGSQKLHNDFSNSLNSHSNTTTTSSDESTISHSRWQPKFSLKHFLHYELKKRHRRRNYWINNSPTTAEDDISMTAASQQDDSPSSPPPHIDLRALSQDDLSSLRKALLAPSTTIDYIDFSNQELGMHQDLLQFVVKLVEEEPSSISELDLRQNELGDDAIQQLARSLKKNHTLHVLHLEENPFNEDSSSYELLQERLHRNHMLHQFKPIDPHTEILNWDFYSSLHGIMDFIHDCKYQRRQYCALIDTIEQFSLSVEEIQHRRETMKELKSLWKRFCSLMRKEMRSEKIVLDITAKCFNIVKDYETQFEKIKVFWRRISVVSKNMDFHFKHLMNAAGDTKLHGGTRRATSQGGPSNDNFFEAQEADPYYSYSEHKAELQAAAATSSETKNKGGSSTPLENVPPLTPQQVSKLRKALAQWRENLSKHSTSVDETAQQLLSHIFQKELSFVLNCTSADKNMQKELLREAQKNESPSSLPVDAPSLPKIFTELCCEIPNPPDTKLQRKKLLRAAHSSCVQEQKQLKKLEMPQMARQLMLLHILFKETYFRPFDEEVEFLDVHLMEMKSQLDLCVKHQHQLCNVDSLLSSLKQLKKEEDEIRILLLEVEEEVEEEEREERAKELCEKHRSTHGESFLKSHKHLQRTLSYMHQVKHMLVDKINKEDALLRELILLEQAGFNIGNVYHCLSDFYQKCHVPLYRCGRMASGMCKEVFDDLRPLLSSTRLHISRHASVHRGTLCNQQYVLKGFAVEGLSFPVLGSQMKLLERAQHRNVIRTSGGFIQGDYVYVMFQLYEEGNLLDWCTKQRDQLSLDTWRSILYQMLSALEHLHSAGIIHCDVSPSNFYVQSHPQQQQWEMEASSRDSAQGVLPEGQYPQQQQQQEARVSRSEDHIPQENPEGRIRDESSGIRKTRPSCDNPLVDNYPRIILGDFDISSSRSDRIRQWRHVAVEEQKNKMFAPPELSSQDPTRVTCAADIYSWAQSVRMLLENLLDEPEFSDLCHLLEECSKEDPRMRYSASQALTHKFFSHHYVHGLKQTTPSFWESYTSPQKISLVDMTHTMRDEMQSLVDYTASLLIGHGRDQKVKEKYNHLRVLSVQHIENKSLWYEYKTKQKEMASNLPEDYKQRLEAATDGHEWVKRQQLMPLLNEKFLFHGTRARLVPILEAYGFDTSRGSLDAMLGAGIYTTDYSTKSDQYCVPDENDTFILLLCRVTMGTSILETNTPVTNYPQGPNESSDEEHYDSLFFNPGTGNRYREFVVYDRRQVYPEFLIEYKREFINKLEERGEDREKALQKQEKRFQETKLVPVEQE